MGIRSVVVVAALVALACAGMNRSAWAAPQKTVPLWPGSPPEAKGTQETDIPTLGLYPVDRAAPAPAVLVCPGGGYGHLAMDHEGAQIAQWLNRNGLAAFVLRYRYSPYRHPVPLNDAKRAMRTIRTNAEEWNVDPGRLGIMGFSAGGHLASTVSTHFDAGDSDAEDPIDRASSRPDFAILCYPVITLQPPHAHMGSRRNLLGDEPLGELVQALSNDLQVTAQTPPTFLFHTADDPGVPVQNSLLYFNALLEQGVPAELHVYEHGRHGVGLAPDIPELATWPSLCIEWLRARGILEE